ncbi:hypothetical protein PVAG01_06226 [Phlyctema vagabunda]|uniref:Uncharacterized protein n=1 Tax=Phlyctema vagabunda TaxID=108571 RepID=A0ABR4PFG4_9HELO
MALWKLKDVYKESPRFTSEPLFLWIDPARIHNATLPKLLPGEANFYQTGPGLILFDSILVHSIWGTKGPNARAITVSNNNDPILVHFSKQGVKSPRVVETLFATWDKHQSYANTLPDSLQPSKECVGDTVAGLEAFRLGLLTVQQIFTPLYRLKNLPSIDAHFHKDLNYVKVGQCKKAKDVGLIGEPFTSGPFEPYISFDLFTHNDRFRDTIAVRTYRGEPSYIFPDFPLDVNFWGHNFYRWTGVPSGRPPRFVSQPPLVLLLVPKTDDKILCQMLVDLAAILSGNNQQPDQPCQQTAIVQNRGFRPSTNEYFLLGQSPFDIYETWIEISIMKTYFQNRPDVWSSQSADTRSFMPPELVRTGILPHLFKKWNINCAGALAKWTVSANLLKPNDWLTKLVDGKQDRIIQTVTLSAKKLLNAKADSRNSHPNQLAIMGCSASTASDPQSLIFYIVH